MGLQRWCWLVVLLAGCNGRTLVRRTLGTAEAGGWTVEVQAIQQHDHVRGGLAPDREEWSVRVAVRARHGALNVELGTLWSQLWGNEGPAAETLAAVSAQICADGERILLRLEVPHAPQDPRWHLLVASPEVLAVETRAATGASCTAAWAAVPPVEAWLRTRLATPIPDFVEVRLGGALADQETFPKRRFQLAMERATPFYFAVRNGRLLPEALDFFVDRLPAFDELAHWGQAGSDFYGPYDPFIKERAVLEAEARKPVMAAHLRTRPPPVPSAYRPEILTWYAGLRAP